MRGADVQHAVMNTCEKETSPHAWSRHKRSESSQMRARNISTCVEQTTGNRLSGRIGQKHLHMRGADGCRLAEEAGRVETSPHAWSRPLPAGCRDRHSRNISTCVEQTTSASSLRVGPWKHLHMRGADLRRSIDYSRVVETSPHAWSRRGRDPHAVQGRRNISTCVEQTKRLRSAARPLEKHLHMRGADLITCSKSLMS